jgi:hypothetical protein
MAHIYTNGSAGGMKETFQAVQENAGGMKETCQAVQENAGGMKETTGLVGSNPYVKRFPKKSDSGKNIPLKN